jgi:glycosyltransferase involved in cell wall biosynthesis
VLVLPSFAEPYPMVVLEALAVGLPTVITADTGLSDRLRAADAAVVTGGDPEEMAAAVLRLLGDRDVWTRMSHAGRALALDEFGPEPLAHDLAAHYRRAVQS